ncbi:MAG: endonuclease [Myxococcales bacterium]|nr:endonuclease [Myxococcales bacterium]
MVDAAISKDHDVTVEAVRAAYCRTLHERLVANAKRRVALEAEEARDLALAEEAEIWRVFGYVSMHEYMERELHYSRHAANERLRVAHALFELPMLAKLFGSGDAPFSVMRELTRVVVPENQEVWLEAVKGKTAAQVQQMVSGLRKGANPEDRPDPKLVRHRIVLDVDGETHAMWMAGRTHADQRHGARLTDDEVARQAAQALIEPGGAGTSAPCLHALTTCKQCKRSSLVANGQEVPLDMATTLRMMCDSARVGDLESDEVERLVPAIPYPTRRKAFIRAKFACEVPGCRSKRCLDVHHIVFRSMGGTNKLSNLLVLCSGHHQALHEGRLSITGRSPDDLVFEFRRDWDEEVHRTMTTVPGEVFVDGEDVTGAVATDHAGPAGTDHAGPAGTDHAVPAGNDHAVPAGTDERHADTDEAVPAGTDDAVPAGTDHAVPAGNDEDLTGIERLVAAMTSALAHTSSISAERADPVGDGYTHPLSR